MMLAEKKPSSMNRKNDASEPATSRLTPHDRRATRYASSVVITIVDVTAIPYAAASALDERKPTTSPTVEIISSQLTCGM